MRDFDQPHIKLPPGLEDFLTSVKTLPIDTIDNYETRTLPLESVLEYSNPQEFSSEFPRPHEHFVISDFLIDLPIIAIDLATTSATYGRVIAYCDGYAWILSLSCTRWLERWKAEKEVNNLVYADENGDSQSLTPS